ncbi:MAG: FAD-dependent oxidoreductase [Planctomycetota bacterium]|nr:MAG: FAD-dependent oxidoreductase [Planctomycetota bacterium]
MKTLDQPRIVIVGGGLAGLAAAVRLTQHGVPCRVVEVRPSLGGRASSFLDGATGNTLDNCQHVAMGCCTYFLQFIETVGAAGCFRRETELNFIGPTGETSRFTASPLPAPFHLLPALGRLKWLTRREQLELGRGLSALLRTPTERLRGVQLSGWLTAHRQSARVQSGFWHLVLVSALSETLDRIDAAYARKVLLDGFARHRSGWEVLIPTTSLSELSDRYAASWLRQHGSIFKCGVGVEAVHLAGGIARYLTTRTGESISADEFIITVPPYRLRSLLESAGCDLTGWPRFDQLETAPIASVHLWFDQPLTNLPHAVLVDRLGQWMFNRSWGAPASADGWYCQVVISASRDVEALGSEATVTRVANELLAIWGAGRSIQLIRGRVVVERRAVLSVTPGVDALRPDQQTPIANLHLAGDWTRTGWPGTMESAVRSGYLAAHRVLARLCRTPAPLPADLPIPRLSRWLFPE